MSASSNALVATLSDELEITLTRVFDAPRALVFEAHSSAEHLSRWWGRGNPLTCELDFRPGGHYRFVEHAPHGEFAFRGEFREIVAPARIVQTFEFEGAPGQVVLQTITFEEADGRTTLTSVARFESTEDRDAMYASGMEQGAATSYDHLDRVLASMSGGATS